MKHSPEHDRQTAEFLDWTGISYGDAARCECERIIEEFHGEQINLLAVLDQTLVKIEEPLRRELALQGSMLFDSE